MTGPSLALPIAFLECRKMACNSCLIHKYLLCLLWGRKQEQKEQDPVALTEGLKGWGRGQEE